MHHGIRRNSNRILVLCADHLLIELGTADLNSDGSGMRPDVLTNPRTGANNPFLHRRRPARASSDERDGARRSFFRPPPMRLDAQCFA